MVNCCANPACCVEFKLLNGGSLYALERRTVDTEFFWLCPACSSTFDLRLDAKGRTVVMSQGEISHARRPCPDGDLRLVSRPTRRLRWQHTTPSGERATSFRV
jgi:hypothetical protein